MILLQNIGFFAQDMFLKNRHMVPLQVISNQSETYNLPDEYVRMVVCEFAKLLAFGWKDTIPVHFVSTSDGSGAIMIIQRQLKKHVAHMSCPTTAPAYTTTLQGVDHHYQLRAKFALSSRHGFNKYYTTHQLAQMDIGITTTCIYYFFTNPHPKKKEGRI
jgi:hypothetical protein